MSDLIDRQNAIDVLEILADKMSDEGQTVMAQAVAVLKYLHPEEPERMAKVLTHEVTLNVDDRPIHATEFLCGACKKKVLGGDDYCSHCGARLDWSGNNE